MDSVTVKVYPNPTVNFTMPKICLNDAVGQFYDSSYTADGETLPFAYQWNFGDPNASPPGNPNNSSLQNPTHRYSAAANYNMSLTVNNSEGCVDSALKIFTVNGDDPEAVFQVTAPPGFAATAAVQLDNLSTVNFGSVVAVQISWGIRPGFPIWTHCLIPARSIRTIIPIRSLRRRLPIRSGNCFIGRYLSECNGPKHHD